MTRGIIARQALFCHYFWAAVKINWQITSPNAAFIISNDHDHCLIVVFTRTGVNQNEVRGLVLGLIAVERVLQPHREDSVMLISKK